MTPNKRALVLGTVAAGLVLLTGWMWISNGRAQDQFSQCRQSVVAGGMESFGTTFTLTNQDNVQMTDKEVFAEPSLLYFGYTFCPDVCPLDTSRNAEVAEILREQGKTINTVMISIDPRRDTPEVLKSFTEAIDPEMIALTGTSEEIDTVSRAWKNFYQIHDQEDSEYYLVDHMTNTFLMMPGKGTVEFFNRNLTTDEMVTRVGCFIDAA